MTTTREQPTTTRARPETSSRGAVWPLLLPWLRVAFVALAALITTGIIAATGQRVGVATASLFAALYLLPVNILCLLAVRRLVHSDGGTIRALIGFDRARLGKDVGWGLLWLCALYLPFVLAIIGTMFALYGTDAFSHFESVFAPDQGAFPALSTTAAIVIGLIVVLTFAPLNAPTEELVFRGYSQGRLQALWGKRTLAILLPSIAFSLQHIFFATTTAGMLVYAVAFFVWGVGCGLIYQRQRRLMPLIVAHAIVNLATSVPALLIPFFMPA